MTDAELKAIDTEQIAGFIYFPVHKIVWKDAKRPNLPISEEEYQYLQAKMESTEATSNA